jgi:hypothetical protein
VGLAVKFCALLPTLIDVIVNKQVTHMLNMTLIIKSIAAFTSLLQLELLDSWILSIIPDSEMNTKFRKLDSFP